MVTITEYFPALDCRLDELSEQFGKSKLEVLIEFNEYVRRRL